MPLVTLPNGQVIDTDIASQPQGQPVRQIPGAQQIPQTGLIGAEQALQGGLQGALGAVGRGADIAGNVLQPFAGTGGQAFQQQGALAGVGGPQAQQQAFAQFNESPGQAFLRERGEQAVLRNASAIGGLGGGNVRKELTRFGTGLAQQDFQNQFNRLGSLSQIGAGAAGQQAGIAQQTGQFGGQAFLGTGQALAGGRTRAGEQIAGQISGTGSSLANLISQQGAGVSDILGQGTGSLANILQGAGQAQGLSQQQLAALLAQISTGASGQVAGLSALPQLQSQQGALGAIGQAAAGVGSLVSAFNPTPTLVTTA